MDNKKLNQERILECVLCGRPTKPSEYMLHRECNRQEYALADTLCIDKQSSNVIVFVPQKEALPYDTATR